jgi:hypothetical protein
VKKPVFAEAINLLDKPLFLTEKHVVGTSEQLSHDVTSGLSDEKGHALKRIYYSLSSWMYINPQPNSFAAKNKTSILRYGLPGINTGHPSVFYHNSSESKENCVVFIDEEDASGTRINVPLQSWNHLVFNYTDTSVDIFVNGELVKTQKHKNTTSVSDADIVEVGYGDNTVNGSGVYGAICNVTYYKRPLESYEIAAIYNLNRYQNPPTYNS